LQDVFWTDPLHIPELAAVIFSEVSSLPFLFPGRRTSMIFDNVQEASFFLQQCILLPPSPDSPHVVDHVLARGLVRPRVSERPSQKEAPSPSPFFFSPEDFSFFLAPGESFPTGLYVQDLSHLRQTIFPPSVAPLGIPFRTFFPDSFPGVILEPPTQLSPATGLRPVISAQVWILKHAEVLRLQPRQIPLLSKRYVPPSPLSC